MGDIRNQFCLHALAFYLFFYGLFESVSDFCNLALQRFKYAQILVNFNLQVAVGHLSRSLQQYLIFLLHPVIDSPEQEKQDYRVNHKSENPKEPEAAYHGQQDKINAYDF